jgi:hypothetical protein
LLFEIKAERRVMSSKLHHSRASIQIDGTPNFINSRRPFNSKHSQVGRNQASPRFVKLLV